MPLTEKGRALVGEARVEEKGRTLVSERSKEKLFWRRIQERKRLLMEKGRSLVIKKGRLLAKELLEEEEKKRVQAEDERWRELQRGEEHEGEP